MKNRRRSWPITAIAAITYIATVLPVYADTSPIISDNMIGSMDDPYFWEIFDTVPADPGAVSYVIDFFDDDGSILDSRIYQYGERLENIKIPGEREDEQYIYRFLEWSPQLSETVTECMAYTAVYQKIDKNDPAGEDTVSGSEIPGSESPVIKAASDIYSPDETTYVSSTSYDVTPFHIVTPAAGTDTLDIREVPDVPRIEGEIPVSENTAPEDDGYILQDKTPEPDIPALPAVTEYPIDPVPADPSHTPDLTAMNAIHNIDPVQEIPYLSPAEIQPILLTDTEIQMIHRPLSKAAGKTPAKDADRSSRPVQKPVHKSTPAPTIEQDIEYDIKHTTDRKTQIPRTSFPLPLSLGGIAACGGIIWSKRQKRGHP